MRVAEPILDQQQRIIATSTDVDNAIRNVFNQLTIRSPSTNKWGADQTTSVDTVSTTIYDQRLLSQHV